MSLLQRLAFRGNSAWPICQHEPVVSANQKLLRAAFSMREKNVLKCNSSRCSNTQVAIAMRTSA